jgi:polysaccharide biosynthesis/export protein
MHKRSNFAVSGIRWVFSLRASSFINERCFGKLLAVSKNKGVQMSRVSDAVQRATLVRMTLIGSFFFVCACGAPINVQPLTSQDISSMQSAGKNHDENYVILPGDTLQIRYTSHPEMNQEAAVQPDGKITASLLGPLGVGGMTTTRVGQLLVEKASDQLRNPEVVVNITRFVERNVHIGGEVKKEGMVRYRRGLTPLQAIIAAGGLTESARADSVILVRRTGESEDETISRKLNLAEAIGEGKEMILLLPEDIVYVPMTSIAEANVWVKQHITDLLPFLRSNVGVNYRTGY